jgi:hypothetical protein
MLTRRSRPPLTSVQFCPAVSVQLTPAPYIEVRKVPLHRFLERHRRTWAVNAPTGPGSAFFVLLVKRQKRDKDEWMILVAPPLYLKRPRDAFVELPRLCGEIHEFLTTTPGISKIRWYFQGFGAYFGVAPTPDELPWGRA